MKAYLDNGATTKVDAKAAAAMKRMLTDNYGNPSSLHFLGDKAKEKLDEARAAIAKKINAKPEEIIFTSGGTEADNLAIRGIAAGREGKKHIITSEIEHPAVLRMCEELEKEGYEVTYVGVNCDGFVSVAEIRDAIRKKTALVTIMHANNEVGTIQPIEEIARICEEKNVPFHTDAVQSFMKLPIDVQKMKVNALSLSAHKIHGPKGVGALYLKKGTPFRKVMQGGGQESNRRGGTENIAGIVGFATATEQEMDTETMLDLREYLIKRILSEIPDTGLNGPQEKRISRMLCNNANIYFKYIEGESLLMHLSLKGIAVSTGSACSSKTLEISHVLQAMGMEAELAHGSLRFTLSKHTTKSEIDYTVNSLKTIVKNLRRISPLTK
jgi:cysteine desulfurase